MEIAVRNACLRLLLAALAVLSGCAPRSADKDRGKVMLTYTRWGDPADLMGATVFLASKASDYVSGHVLVVDGGYLVR